MMWMNGNDKLSPAAKAACSTDISDKGSSNRTTTQKSHGAKSHSSGTRLDPCAPERAMVLLPAQPFIQDPSMPLLGSPDTSTQLEEAKRRLEQEGSRAGKLAKLRSYIGGGVTGAREHRGAFSPASTALQPPRAHARQPGLPQGALPQDPSSSEEHSSCSQKSDTRVSGKPATAASASMNTAELTVVIYFFCEEPIPYSTRIHARPVTLLQFKQLVAKKGQYKYYFKRACNEFETGYVYDEIDDDDAVLPLLDGKVSAKISRLM